MKKKKLPKDLIKNGYFVCQNCEHVHEIPKIKTIERPDEYAEGDLDIEIRKNIKKSEDSEWMPFEIYELVQVGYPTPNRGEMIIREYGGTDIKGHLIPPKGEWCRVEDIKKIFDQINIKLDI